MSAVRWTSTWSSGKPSSSISWRPVATIWSAISLTRSTPSGFERSQPTPWSVRRTKSELSSPSAQKTELLRGITIVEIPSRSAICEENSGSVPP